MFLFFACSFIITIVLALLLFLIFERDKDISLSGKEPWRYDE